MKLPVNNVDYGIILKRFLKEIFYECGRHIRIGITVNDGLFCGCRNELFGCLKYVISFDRPSGR
jgi:hypothetical protein